MIRPGKSSLWSFIAIKLGLSDRISAFLAKLKKIKNLRHLGSIQTFYQIKRLYTDDVHIKYEI